nr:unnamed protein product [Spirometra erinaceieuropaei]
MTESKYVLRRPNTDTLWGLIITTLDDSITFVAEVYKKSPADQAGLKPNDVVLAINGESCENRTHEDICKVIEKSELKLKVLTRESTDDEKMALKNSQKNEHKKNKPSEKVESHKAKKDGAKRPKSGEYEKEHSESHEKKEEKSAREKAATSSRPHTDEPHKHAHEGKETKHREDLAKAKSTTTTGKPMEIKAHSKNREVALSSDVVLVGIQKRDTTRAQTRPQPTNGNQATHFGATVSTASPNQRSATSRKEDPKTAPDTADRKEAKEQEEVKTRKEKKARSEEEGAKAEKKVKEGKRKEHVGAADDSKPKAHKDRSVTPETKRVTADGQGTTKTSEAAKIDGAADVPVNGQDSGTLEKENSAVKLRQRGQSISTADVEKKKKEKDDDQKNRTRSMVVRGSSSDFPSLDEVKSNLQPGSQEVKIPGVGSNFTLYHRGPRDSSGRYGVAIAQTQQADSALLAWGPVNDRMAYVRLKVHFTNIPTVLVYAPTSAAEQRDKEAFYLRLQVALERLPRLDLRIVDGDWNDRTGPGDPTTSHLLGRFGHGS